MQYGYAMRVRLGWVMGEGEAARLSSWGVGCGSSGYLSSMSASAISIGEGVVAGGMSGERATEMLKWVGVGDSGVCGRLPVFVGGYDGSDVDEISLDDAVGVDKGGAGCSCSNNCGGVGYGVARPIGTSEYSDVIRLLDIVDSAGEE